MIIKNKVLEEYQNLFLENPPRCVTLSYEDPLYQELMTKAIKSVSKITPQQIDNYINKNKVVFDIDFKGSQK